MAESLLRELNYHPSRVGSLSSRERRRLLSFLMAWEFLDDLHACLDILLQDRPDSVSLLDLRARALAAQQRYDQALEVMQQRLSLRSSMSARALLAQCYLAQGDHQAAQALSDALVAQSPEAATPWRTGGEVALAQGDLRGAAAAFHQLGTLTPEGIGYLLGMLSLYQAQGDWVTASGYAVRLLNAAERPDKLAPPVLRRLQTYFEASQEETRVRTVQEALEASYAQGLAEIRAILHPPAAQPAAEGELQPRPEAAGPAAADSAYRPAPVAVDSDERARITQAVEERFGFQDLLPGQLEALAAVLRGENALVVLPTGGGKSLCYQLPAVLAAQGTTLVISPLIALMKDQIDSLPEALQPLSTTINSSLDGDVLRQQLHDTAEGRYRLLYAAPERLRQPAFLHALRRAGINRLVVDEAHCVSVWGHDFRPDYLKLFQARQALGSPPILALTATAPPRVRRDIAHHLSPHEPMATVTGDMIRANLHLEVVHAANRDEKLQYLAAFCKATPGSGIVYADTRARCEQLASLLRSQGVDAAHYHAGIHNRAAVQEAFMTGRRRVMVATIAFGMGIDKPDIRFILHFMPPASLESYYQEAGRAGRDGEQARCVLLYAPSDRSLLTRRARGDLLTVESLRGIYAAAARRLKQQPSANVAPRDLEGELQISDTQLRVGLSILEENGLLQRGPDIPRTALLRVVRRSPSGDEDAALADFCREAGLQPHGWQRVHLVDAASRAGLGPEGIEAQLLAWSDAGHLQCRFSGRDMLLTRLTPPEDVAQRIGLWLDRFATIQMQRIDELVAYANTDHCRHDHLSAYLGGRRVDGCGACDNCIVMPAIKPERADDGRHLLTILECLAAAPHGWGSRNLVRILQGDSGAPESAHTNRRFGALKLRSQTAINNLIERLVQLKLLNRRRTGSGAAYFEISPAGARVLKAPKSLDQLLETQSGAAVQKKPSADGKVDDALFERLRAWRLETAKEEGLPPYIVASDKVLRRIAAEKPGAPPELLAIKGIGAKKLAAYGEAILAIVQDPGAHAGAVTRSGTTGEGDG